MVEDKTWGSRLFSGVNLTLLAIIALVTLLPFVHVLAGSLTTAAEMSSKSFILFPTVISFDAYTYIFSTDMVLRAMLVSIGVTAGGTLISMCLSVLMAYGLARRDLDGRRTIMFLVVFTMLFNGGMIPTFLVVKELGLIDNYLALILPTAINAFNLIILRSFFQNLPEGLEESAKIDGCNDFGILLRIVLPLSMPVLATISLFYAVTYWNTYMHAILYLNDAQMYPMQVVLRQIVILATGMSNESGAFAADYIPPPEQTIKMAVIVVATVPILIVYPFLQKYFAKGALVGSIKG
ncbi:carbohydrate ABC transporter permease [Paenibacillus sp. IB182496]|uniref:Carbohydrate ABC transporter permease n=1 Tax=Paenibacillus sabuli TaxID=2772509 RepID=A0A927BU28_9BACL|nr:carbohydrate ABC transporter permease [Paenibacillus sabuli]MBD2845529.1 carbohydrate ABC transporter permease [Paenibacillus sabuli]